MKLKTVIISSAILLIIFAGIIISPLLFSEEYKFRHFTSRARKVRVQGSIYSVFRPWEIVNEYDELEYTDRILFEETDDNRDIYIILDDNGNVVRDVNIIRKALLTNKYTQLSYEEIRVVTEIPPDIEDFFDDYLEDYKTKYFWDAYAIINFLEKEKREYDINNIFSKKELWRFSKDLLRYPERAIQYFLLDLAFAFKNEIELKFDHFKQIENSIISYKDYLDLDKVRLAYIYLNSIMEIHYLYDIFEQMKLDYAKAIVNNINTKTPIKSNLKSLRRMNVDKFFLRIKKMFFEIYEGEDFFIELLSMINLGKSDLLKEEIKTENLAYRCATYFPVYGYKKTSIRMSRKTKKKFRKRFSKERILFFDDFKDDLDKWELSGKPKPELDRKPFSCLNSKGDGLFYSSATTECLFSPFNGDITIETKVFIGSGQASFGFGRYSGSRSSDKGVEPIVGFLINETPGMISFIVNNERVINKTHRIPSGRTTRLRIVLSYYSGIEFRINNDIVYSSRFRLSELGSDSVIISAMSDDYYWDYVIVTQKKSKPEVKGKSLKNILELLKEE